MASGDAVIIFRHVLLLKIMEDSAADLITVYVQLVKMICPGKSAARRNCSILSHNFRKSISNALRESNPCIISNAYNSGFYWMSFQRFLLLKQKAGGLGLLSPWQGGLHVFHRWVSTVDHLQIITSHEQTFLVCLFFFNPAHRYRSVTFCSTSKIISPDHYLSSLPMLTLVFGSKKKKAKGSF